MTTVSRDTFVSARPVGRNRLNVDVNELRNAPVHTGAIDIRPDVHSYGREAPRDRPVVRPDRAIFDRPVVAAGPGARVQQAPVRTGIPVQPRRPEAPRPPLPAADRPVSNGAARPPQSGSPPQNSPPRRDPVRDYRDARSPQREMPQTREVPQAREVPQTREVPQAREVPQTRELPPPRYAPPPRPAVVTPPPPPPSAAPPKPAPAVHAEHVEHSEHVERVDRNDRSHDHNRN